ncbi:FadR/GntR family transcriptional regulator [Filimonas effusa]|uniref:FadR family transcriptional regulator n=1 Tax=Filimonas effusa TaxID=2508721 RepID=A0A4Q1D3R0_9BACT|nr:FCD domain-containing protein [Filimonas effusa]RXK81949.1 FadR family transcriptional regulator [Filimonas effusa]
MAKLSDRVIAALQRDISQGAFKVGEKIPPEPELMERYQVGRSTVREAVKTLAISGVLRVQQGDGTYVHKKTQRETLSEQLRRSDAVEINEVRTLLETEIVRRAALHRTEDDLQRIRQWLDKREKAISQSQVKECVDADIQFHLAIADAASNKVMAELYKSFTVVIRDFFRQRDAGSVKWFAASHPLHEALYMAISRKQQQRAASITKEILQNNN